MARSRRPTPRTRSSTASSFSPRRSATRTPTSPRARCRRSRRASTPFARSATSAAGTSSHLADEPNAAPLLRAPLLEGGPSPQTAQYAGLLLHAISQGAAAAAAAPDAAQAMDGVLNVIGLLLALLPDAAALVREGGAPPGGCRDYTALMAAIDAEPLLAPR